MIAVLERMVYGIRRIVSEIMMISAVPERTISPELKLERSAIPRTEPGMMYGNMVRVSRRLVSIDGLRTVR